MLDCTDEVLAALRLAEFVDMVAHSQATIPALAYAARNPGWVRRLVLVGAVDGTGWRGKGRAGETWRGRTSLGWGGNVAPARHDSARRHAGGVGGASRRGPVGQA